VLANDILASLIITVSRHPDHSKMAGAPTCLERTYNKRCIIPEQPHSIPIQISEFHDDNLLVCVEFISGLETKS